MQTAVMCHLPSLQVPNFALGCSDIPLAEGSEIANGGSGLILQWFTPPDETLRDQHPHGRVIHQCCGPGQGTQLSPPAFLLDVVYGAGAVKKWGNEDFQRKIEHLTRIIYYEVGDEEEEAEGNNEGGGDGEEDEDDDDDEAGDGAGGDGEGDDKGADEDGGGEDEGSRYDFHLRGPLNSIGPGTRRARGHTTGKEAGGTSFSAIDMMTHLYLLRVRQGSNSENATGVVGKTTCMNKGWATQVGQGKVLAWLESIETNCYSAECFFTDAVPFMSHLLYSQPTLRLLHCEIINGWGVFQFQMCVGDIVVAALKKGRPRCWKRHISMAFHVASNPLKNQPSLLCISHVCCYCSTAPRIMGRLPPLEDMMEVLLCHGA